ncbi:deleted in malignant brain tumors 1 protein-like [Ruditapes philippinarum]|uniref:deleted in malignant brain tumors 1 protein-like n=1 Tax=Ruditapes philippinarum TaxID=129788 RepID=UPI00295BFECA|nr:deleted in malignant brain tumors 1 protein-like [Ruditapes philippinarum]
MFLLYIFIFFVTISTVKSEGGAICDCQDVGILKDIVQQVLIEQRMESARISRLEERLKAYERTGPIPNDRLEKLEQNVKDISMKFNETVTEAKNKNKGFNRGIGAIVKRTLISEKKERQKLISNMNEIVNEHKVIIEKFKVAINNTIDERFEYIHAKQVKYKNEIKEFLDDTENDTASFIETVFNNISIFKDKLMTDVNGNHNSIKELNNDIQRISSDIVSVNQHVGHNRNMVDTLSNQVKENKEWEQWSSWGECSELCGAGLRERVRTCASPFGCIGNSKDFKICNIETCKVRLVGGSNQYEGRLEVWHNESWGTVCDDGFTALSASVVCKMLNYPHTNPFVFGSTQFGEGTLPIHLDDVRCTGTEISLPQCQHRGFGTHDCSHGEDVGISCTPVRLVNGSNQHEGRLEVWHDNSWGTVCDDDFTALSATVVCNMLNYPHDNPLVFKSAYFGAGKWPIHLDDVECTGTEISLLQCPHRSWGSNNCGHGQDVGISCTQVRLVNGSNQYEGRLEIWHDESWGTVCDDSFTVLSASVVCKMLNYQHTNPLVFGSAHFGEGTIPIHLDDVQCTGTEISLTQCQHRGFGTHNCGHGEDVGISCTPVRLVNGSNQYEGRLEVWHYGTWGTVCDDYFDVLSAKVVCKMLKYPHADPTVFGAAHFGRGTLSTLLDDVKCTGSETSVFQCPHYDWRDNDCSNNEDVGILCK